MIYSEEAYFNGNHCQHLAARDEHIRLRRLNRQAQQAFDRHNPTGRDWFDEYGRECG